MKIQPFLMLIVVKFKMINAKLKFLYLINLINSCLLLIIHLLKMYIFQSLTLAFKHHIIC